MEQWYWDILVGKENIAVYQQWRSWLLVSHTHTLQQMTFGSHLIILFQRGKSIGFQTTGKGRNGPLNIMAELWSQGFITSRNSRRNYLRTYQCKHADTNSLQNILLTQVKWSTNLYSLQLRSTSATAVWSSIMLNKVPSVC